MPPDTGFFYFSVYLVKKREMLRLKLSEAAELAKKYGRGMRNDSVAGNLVVFPTDDFSIGCIAVLRHKHERDQAVPHWLPNLHALTDDGWYAIGANET